MTTAAEFRSYAQECIESAVKAPHGPIRDQFLELAKLWTAAALLRENGNRSELFSKVTPEARSNA